MIEKKPLPVLYYALCKTDIKFLTRHWCGNFFASSTKRVTVQYFVVVIEGISGETQRAV